MNKDHEIPTSMRVMKNAVIRSFLDSFVVDVELKDVSVVLDLSKEGKIEKLVVLQEQSDSVFGTRRI